MKLRVKPYKKYWRIENGASPSALQSTRAQAGMVFTAARSNHPVTDANGRVRDPALIRVHGTLDSMRKTISARYFLEKRVIYSLVRNPDGTPKKR